jgi:hypothetical protein
LYNQDFLRTPGGYCHWLVQRSWECCSHSLAQKGNQGMLDGCCQLLAQGGLHARSPDVEVAADDVGGTADSQDKDPDNGLAAAGHEGLVGIAH